MFLLTVDSYPALHGRKVYSQAGSIPRPSGAVLNRLTYWFIGVLNPHKTHPYQNQPYPVRSAAGLVDFYKEVVR
jgi:hypothetical protein